MLLFLTLFAIKCPERDDLVPIINKLVPVNYGPQVHYVSNNDELGRFIATSNALYAVMPDNERVRAQLIYGIENDASLDVNDVYELTIVDLLHHSKSSIKHPVLHLLHGKFDAQNATQARAPTPFIRQKS